MKRSVLIAAVVLAAGSVLAADPKGEVSAAAKKLADGGNYSWKQTTENAGGGGGGGGGGGRGGFGGGPQEGQAADGLVHITMTFGDNSIETLRKGTNTAFKGQDGWMTAADMAANGGGGGGGGGGRGFGRGGFGGAAPTPAEAALNAAGKVKGFTMSGGAFVGELTDDGAKELARPPAFGGGRRGGGGGGGGGGNFTPPEITGAKGTATFWVTDGVLTKYELKLQYKTTNFQGDPQDVNRTTTVEFKDVGKTKVNAPADIVKKLS